jgi:hypothetical protein
MQPYGKNKKMRRNLPNNHPPKKGYVNWWEVELGGVDKGSERQRAKRDMVIEINTDYIYECMDCEFTWTSPFDDHIECPKCESRNIKEV